MITVYRAYDTDGRLLYIGCTNNFTRRIGYHRNVTEWYPDAAKWLRNEYPDRERAEMVEARAIRRLQPIHNIKSQRDEKERWGTGTPLPWLTRESRRASLERMNK